MIASLEKTLQPSKREQVTLCFNCTRYGHFASNCPLKSPLTKFTKSQQCMFDFLSQLPANEIPKCPNLNPDQLQTVFEQLKLAETNFWKKFEIFSKGTFRQDNFDYKKACFGTCQRKLGFWWAIGSTPSTLIHFVRGLSFKEYREPPRFFTSSSITDPEQQKWVQDWLNKSLKSHKIIPIPEKYVWICENVFIAEWDTHRKNRLIFDGRFCNLFKRKLKYKLPLPEEVLKFLSKSGRVLSCDASSAFFHIPNAPEEMVKNCFCVRDKYGEKKYFCFTSPPFGVTQMPRCFQKIMENVRDFFNFIGMPSLLYIDDLISLVVNGLNRQHDLAVSEWYYQILRNLGITYNAKSTFVPNSKFKFLGHTSTSLVINRPPTSLVIDPFWKKVKF